MRGLKGIGRFGLHKTSAHIDRALCGLLRDAHSNVASVQRRFEEAGLRPDDIQGARDLPRLPVATRESFDSPSFRDQLRRGTDPRKCVISWTSGSTGQQLPVHMNSAEAFYRRLLLFNAIRRNLAGRFPWTIVEAGVGSKKPASTRRIAGVVRVVHIPRTDHPRRQAEQLAACRPTVITGHPTCLELVAEAVLAQSGKIHPRLVVCRGEILLPATRTLLAKAFGCRVVDYYSCDEIGNIAWECPEREGVFHANTDGCIVEILDEDDQPVSPGRPGSVVVTNLFNRTMPFIRYGLGDQSSLHSEYGDKPCICGHRGPSLSPILGREAQFFRMADGTRVSQRTVSTMVNASMRDLDQDHQVRRYQVIQETLSSIRVRVQANSPLPADAVASIARDMERLGPGIVCSVEHVNDLPLDASGKFQRFISRA